MTSPIVYIDRSSIREGKAAEVRDNIAQLIDFIEPREPQLIGYRFHFDEQEDRMTVVSIHPDSASLELHMEVGKDAFQEFSDLIDLEAIEVYGAPSDRVLSLLEDKAAMLGDGGTVEVHGPQGGFMRLAAAD